MQKKYSISLIVVIIVILGVGGYLIYHKNKPATYSSNSQTNTNTKSNSSSQTQTTTVNNSILITKTNATVGNYLADPDGNTLYTNGTSVENCIGSCLTAWPPYLDNGATTGLPTNVSTVKLTDNGKAQYTYKGMPLYYFASDNKGQVNGNGVGGFTVAKP